MATLNDRLRDVKPCWRCKATDPWAAGEDGEPKPSMRCDCRRGRLLAIGDAARARARQYNSAA